MITIVLVSFAGLDKISRWSSRKLQISLLNVRKLIIPTNKQIIGVRISAGVTCSVAYLSTRNLNSGVMGSDSSCGQAYYA